MKPASARGRPRPAVAAALLLATVAAVAEPPPSAVPLPDAAPATFTDLRTVGQVMAAGITTVPNGPAIPVPTAGDREKSCAELYRERVDLYARTASYTPAYYDDPRNQAIAWLGTVTAPAWYLFSATAVESWYERQRVAAVERRLDALRQVSAGQDCFVRR